MNDSRLRRLGDKASGAATLINEGCKIIGTITGSGSFLINGEVDGDCELDGTVTLAGNGLWKGTIRAANVIVAGRSSPNSLYAEDLVTFEDDAGAYDQKDAAGFVKLNALRLRTLAGRDRRG